MKQGKKVNTGLSLLEIIVVVGIFAILGILATRSVLLTLRGSKKSDSLVRARENLDYAVAVIERQLRNAESIPSCTGAPLTTVTYLDELGATTTFSCVSVGPTGYIASGSARLTSNEVAITTCSFTCNPGLSGTPPSIDVDLVAQDVTNVGVEASQVSVSTKIYLRTY